MLWKCCAVLCLVTQLCPTLCEPVDCSQPGSSVHGDSPDKNTEVGCHFLLQRIFPTQGSNVGLLHCSNTYPIHWIRPSHRGRLKAEEKGMTEDEVVEWHHRLNGNGHGQTLRDGEGWGGLTCCSSWGCREWYRLGT